MVEQTTLPPTGVAATARPVTPIGILAQRLARISEQLDAVDGLDAALLAEVHDVHALADGLEPYLSRCTTPESPALQHIASRTAARNWSDDSPLEQEMLSGHVEGQLLKMLIHLTGARRVLDLGMFTGYSALAMAEALPPDGTVVACEVDADVAALAGACFAEAGPAATIDVHVGPAHRTLERLAAAADRFDLVFLDADKAGYVDYLSTLLETGLLAPHGVICADNTLMQGEPYLPHPMTPNGEAIAAFNRTVAADSRVEQVIIPLRDGLTLIRRAAGR